MFDALTILSIAVIFALAGAVKGVIGLGLPTVSLALLTTLIGLPHAMVLLIVPSLITNIWQAVAGGNAKAILLRLWPFLVMAMAAVWLGSMALTRLDLSLLSALLGLLLVIYSAVSLAGLRLTITMRQEAWAGPLLGAVNGILTGMTGSFVVPGVMFLQSIGLPRDMLIQAMGMLFAVSTLALALALRGNNFLTMELGAVSAAALLPAIGGMMFGQWVRKKLSEQLFRRVFFVSLLLLGIYIIISALDT